MGNVNESWCSPRPEAVASLFARATVPWWIAGGWAIDLFLNVSTRAHADLDLGCFRADLGVLLEQLPDWDIRVASGGVLTPLARADRLEPTAHGLWCRPSGSAFWVLEILVEEREGPDWIYRRDRRIRRAAADVVVFMPSGLRYLRPEVQLLYKSKNARARDDADFEAAWPALGLDARAWLIAQLHATNPDHAWLALANRG